ncbi:MAG: nucleotidyltransferase domain-containing protein [Nitrospirota bacterium]|nr:nucleotidyltransferase domain-containing protein [Nitrospirota bacterium]
MPLSSDNWPDMPTEAKENLKGYLTAITQQLGDAIQSIVLYGSLARGEYVSGRSNINLMVVMNQVSGDLLQCAGGVQRKWSKERVIAPLMFTPEELNASFDVFPLEFLDMNDHHVILDGPNPFTSCMINDQRLLTQCEQEIRGNLIRVRQRYVEGWGRIEAVHALLPISLTTLIPCFRGLYRQLGHSSNGTAEAILNQLPNNLGMEPGALHEVWLLKRGQSTPGQKEWPRLMERYLAVLLELINRVDALKREGQFT